jgi:hypothetical protein
MANASCARRMSSGRRTTSPRLWWEQVGDSATQRVRNDCHRPERWIAGATLHLADERARIARGFRQNQTDAVPSWELGARAKTLIFVTLELLTPSS